MSDRGHLRVYLGAAPGVGKTFAMLNEGERRLSRGADVVVGFVETHGRARTEAAVGRHEVLPRVTRSYRGSDFTEMDLDGVLARHPRVALIDELAHTNVPGGRNEKRWQDIEELLAAGIDVITTVNVQHLESLNDVVEKITGVPQRETVPDAVVRSADQIELVDMSPESLRRRMAHGNVYAADKVDAAMSHYFRVGNLAALRELALLWVADRVDEGLQKYRAEHDIGGVWEARERVVVSLTGGSEGDTLIRRGARIAARATGGDLLAVHVVRSDGLTGGSPGNLTRQRQLVESLGGSFHSVVGDDIPAALLDFARAENATQLVLGASRRGRLTTFVSGAGIGQTVTRLSGDIDVHMVTHDRAASTGWQLPTMTGGLSPRRRMLGGLVALLVLPALTALLHLLRTELNTTSQVLAFLVAVVGVALVGGIYPALFAAVLASLLLNFFFTPPLYEFTIAARDNVVALVIFLAVAVMVSSVVDGAARRLREAARARAEAELLSILAGSVLRGEKALPALVERLREAFGMSSVTLLTRSADDSRGGGAGAPSAGPHGSNRGTGSASRGAAAGGRWTCVAYAGTEPCADPGEADVEVKVSDSAVLALTGRTLPAEDRRLLGAFAAQAAVALEQRRLRQQAADVKPLAEADRMRTALLNAVSHDLRTPLASAKVAVSSLRGQDMTWTDDERAELLATAEESLDRLIRLVENLLDMSRLDAGVLQPALRPVDLEELVPQVLHGLGTAAATVQARDMTGVPPLRADSGLLERVVENLVVNALGYSPPDKGPVITASALGDRVELRIVDHGPGIPAAQREQVFRPFQRGGDRSNDTGVGLGLALSRGLVEAMHGTLEPEETPGGGLTMVVTLPAATVSVPGQSAAAAPEPTGAGALPDATVSVPGSIVDSSRETVP